MIDFDFKEFYNNIQKDIIEAYKYVTFLERNKYLPEYYNGKNNDEIEFSEELQFNEERLTDVLESIKLKFDLAFDLLNLNNARLILNEDLNKYKGKYNILKLYNITDEFYSPVLDILSKYLKALTSHIDTEKENENVSISLFSLLEQILEGTAKMLSDRNIEPSNETEVKREVYNT